MLLFLVSLQRPRETTSKIALLLPSPSPPSTNISLISLILNFLTLLMLIREIQIFSEKAKKVSIMCMSFQRIPEFPTLNILRSAGYKDIIQQKNHTVSNDVTISRKFQLEFFPRVFEIQLDYILCIFLHYVCCSLLSYFYRSIYQKYFLTEKILDVFQLD